MTKTTIFLPVLLIIIGTGWLLTTLGIAPQIDWIWTLGLGATGFLTFVIGGFDKMTFVSGLFFIVASFLSIMRQTGRISLNVEVPILVILIGVLLLIAHSPKIPTPPWVMNRPDS